MGLSMIRIRVLVVILFPVWLVNLRQGLGIRAQSTINVTRRHVPILFGI